MRIRRVSDLLDGRWLATRHVMLKCLPISRIWFSRLYTASRIFLSEITSMSSKMTTDFANSLMEEDAGQPIYGTVFLRNQVEEEGADFGMEDYKHLMRVVEINTSIK